LLFSDRRRLIEIKFYLVSTVWWGCQFGLLFTPRAHSNKIQYLIRRIPRLGALPFCDQINDRAIFYHNSAV